MNLLTCWVLVLQQQEQPQNIQKKEGKEKKLIKLCKLNLAMLNNIKLFFVTPLPFFLAKKTEFCSRESAFDFKRN